MTEEKSNYKNKVKLQTVLEEEGGMRLDRWFKKYYPNLKYGHLQKLLRKGDIRISKRRAQANVRLSMGEEIRIPPLDSAAVSSKVKDTETTRYHLSSKERQSLKDILLYKDDHIIAVNKPSGLAVQGGSKQTRHLDGMLAAFAREENQERARLVHRLDKETSGALLLARTVPAARALGAMFKGREMHKYYWALCSGVPEMVQGTIELPLRKGTMGDRMRVDREEGKYACTHYRVMEYAGKKLSWVAFWPVTGRTHQIRVHAATAGFPIIGDDKYGGFYDAEEIQLVSEKGADQLCLHARRLFCDYPENLQGRHTSKTLDVTAPLPPHMKKLWQAFGFNEKLNDDPFEML